MVKNLVSFTNQKPKKTRIDSHLAAYATLAGVALAAPAVAKADIVYSGMVNISVPNNFDGVYINFVTGQTGTSGASVPGWNWNPYNGGTGLQFFWNGTPNGGLSLDTTTYAVLPNGAPISSANVYLNTTSTAATAAWRAGSTCYLGIRIINSQTNQTNYGWVHFDTTGGTGFPATIVEYAYENTGSSIFAGDLGAPCPEPSIPALLGMMAAGALGVRAWRKTQGSLSNE